MVLDVSVIAAFVAGVLSITSPCVLPLLPLYIAHMAGTADPSVQSGLRPRILLNASAYVLGFSVVFIAVGIAFGAAGSLVSAASIVSSNRTLLVRTGGIILVLLGLHQIGIIRIPGLSQARQFSAHRTPTSSTLSSFVVGVTFAAGWSPCAGPILGAILTMAAGEASVTRSAMLLAVYSAGLAVPFFALATFGASSGMLKRLAPHMETLRSGSGAVMLAIGLLMVAGIYQQFFTRIVSAAPWTPWEPNL
jgi:cytochrome c-type biogenesis protein